MKLLRLLSVALVAAGLLLAGPSHASQNGCVLPTVGPMSGLTTVTNINNCFAAILTQSSGSSAPSSPVTYQVWADTSTSLLKVYDGSTWLILGKFSGSTWTPYAGGVTTAAPSSTGSANAYVLTYSPAPGALVTGQAYTFIANFANTGAATLTVNGLGPFAITKNGTTPLVSGDINSGQVVKVVYDGTRVQMVSPTGNSALSGGSLTGSLEFKKGASVASASTTNIWSGADGNLIHVTGTTTITSFGTAPQAGADRWLIFDDALTLTNGINLVLPGVANYTTSAGDLAHVTADTTTKAIVQIFKADGTPVVSGAVASLASLHQQVFTSSGTFTCPAGTTTSTIFKFTLTGGGGGGAGGASGADYRHGGGGGGSGGSAVYYATGLSASDTIAVTVGGGGSAGASGSNTTIVVGATTITAGGGSAGSAASGSAIGMGGAGGTASNGTMNLGGEAGGNGQPSGPTNSPDNFTGGAGGNGGSSIWGGGGRGSITGAAGAGSAPGAGGGGGGTGAAGAGGQVLVEWVL